MSRQRPPFEPLTRARAKVVSDLDRGSARKKHGLFRIEGWRALASAVAAGVHLEDIVVRELVLDPERMELLARANATRISTVSSRGMSRLTSVLEDQGVVATARMHLTGVDDLLGLQRVLALDGVQDPGNVGTLIRTAAWFGIDAIIADSNTADYFNPKVVRAAAGALWDVKLVRTDALAAEIDRFKAGGFACFGTDVNGGGVTDWRSATKSMLVLGSEGHGLSDDVRSRLDRFVHVKGHHGPRRGVESLNVAAAGSILISQWADLPDAV